MSSGVRFIIKTLIKVPIIIIVTYFFLNLALFITFYFRMLSFSYVIANQVSQANYLTQYQYDSLSATLQKMDDGSTYIDGTKLFVDCDGSGNNVKVQAGKSLKITVAYQIHIVLPFYQASDSGTYKENNTDITEWTNTDVWNIINVTNTVPALKYYPDLE